MDETTTTMMTSEQAERALALFERLVVAKEKEAASSPWPPGTIIAVAALVVGFLNLLVGLVNLLWPGRAWAGFLKAYFYPDAAAAAKEAKAKEEAKLKLRAERAAKEELDFELEEGSELGTRAWEQQPEQQVSPLWQTPHQLPPIPPPHAANPRSLPQTPTPQSRPLRAPPRTPQQPRYRFTSSPG